MCVLLVFDCPPRLPRGAPILLVRLLLALAQAAQEIAAAERASAEDARRILASWARPSSPDPLLSSEPAPASLSGGSDEEDEEGGKEEEGGGGVVGLEAVGPDGDGGEGKELTRVPAPSAPGGEGEDEEEEDESAALANAAFAGFWDRVVAGSLESKTRTGLKPPRDQFEGIVPDPWAAAGQTAVAGEDTDGEGEGEGPGGRAFWAALSEHLGHHRKRQRQRRAGGRQSESGAPAPGF